MIPRPLTALAACADRGVFARLFAGLLVLAVVCYAALTGE